MLTLRTLLSALTILILVGGLSWSLWRAEAAQNFARLNKEDHQAFSERFAKEIYPLMQRNGKDGCVGCHSSGKIVADLRLSGKPDKDFAYLLKEGFFLPDDAGSILSRITDPDPERRMPPEKRQGFSGKEVETLRQFVKDLDKKNRPGAK